LRGLEFPVRGSVLSSDSCLRSANKRYCTAGPLDRCDSVATVRADGKISLWGTAQCAASNRPLPGAVTALILYHRYFLRGDPPGERPKAGLFRDFYGGRGPQNAQRINRLDPRAARPPDARFGQHYK
jgi:hypothetical protein